MDSSPSADAALRLEAQRFSRYLLDRIAPQELVDRYVAAHRRLLPNEPDRADAAWLAFLRKHPWSLPFLDAAAGIFRPRSLLRRKLLLMAAVLETSPFFAEQHFPRRTSTPRLTLELVTHAAAAGVKLAVGALLLPLAGRGRND